MEIVTDNSAVIFALEKRITELEKELAETKQDHKDDADARERFEYGVRNGE